MKVLALDPGGVTGWATFEIEAVNGSFIMRPDLTSHFKAGQLKVGRTEKHHKLLWIFLSQHQPDVIVIERFEKRNNDFSLLISCEYIGVTEVWAQLHPDTSLVYQGSSEALTFCDNEKMALLGLLMLPYTVWKDANAAQKHLIYFLINWRYRTIRNRILQVWKPE